MSDALKDALKPLLEGDNLLAPGTDARRWADEVFARICVDAFGMSEEQARELCDVIDVGAARIAPLSSEEK